MLHTEPQVSSIVTRVVRGEWVSPELVQAARETIRTMRHEATTHGLTEAEVVKAVLRPAFRNNRGCGCSTCVDNAAEVLEV